MQSKIGFAGSAFDIGADRDFVKEISINGDFLPFVCFDDESLPIEIGKKLVANGKNVICFTTGLDESKKAAELGFFPVNTGLPRLFREIVFVQNVDALFVFGGGSGTLMEVTFAYQLGKPIFLVEGLTGSVESFRNRFLDKREKLRIRSVKLQQLEDVINSIDKK